MRLTALNNLFSRPCIFLWAFIAVLAFTCTNAAAASEDAAADMAINAVKLSLSVALWAVGLSVAPAMLAGWILSRKNFPGKALFEGFINASLVMPPVIVGFFALLLLSPNSFVGQLLENCFGLRVTFNRFGAILAGMLVGFPLLVSSLRQGFDAIDRQLEQAAELFGANTWEVFRYVTLPLSLPAFACGIILAFARCLGEFGATITLAGNIPGQTQTLSLAIFSLINTPGGQGFAFVLAGLSAALSVGATYLSSKMRDKFLRDNGMLA